MNSLVLGFALLTPAQPPTTLPPPPPVPPPVIVEQPPPAVVPVPVALTVEEFVRVFVPVPGPQKVCLIHPKSCKPVEVCFTLPDCGCPPKVRRNRHHLEFDYGRHWVDIRFRHNGTVDVKTR